MPSADGFKAANLDAIKPAPAMRQAPTAVDGDMEKFARELEAAMQNMG